LLVSDWKGEENENPGGGAAGCPSDDFNVSKDLSRELMKSSIRILGMWKNMDTGS
jgi:hypothetical protein